MRQKLFVVAAVISLLVCVGATVLSLSNVFEVGVNILGHEFAVNGPALVASTRVVIVASLILPGWWLIHWTRQSMKASAAEHRQRAGLCRECGYDLRATSGTCPECGTAVPKEHADKARRPA